MSIDVELWLYEFFNEYKNEMLNDIISDYES